MPRKPDATGRLPGFALKLAEKRMPSQWLCQNEGKPHRSVMKQPDTLDNLSQDPVLFEESQPSGETSFAEILSQYEQEHGGVREGETLNGTVIAVTGDSVFVNIGKKTEGVLAAARLRDASGIITVKAGDSLLVAVTGHNAEGYYELSTVRVERPKDWTGLQAAFAEHRVIGGVVKETIKGGLRVDVGVPAFMPASRSGVRDVADLEKLVGQEIECRITKLDVEHEDVVVDRRVVLEEREKRAKEERFGSLREGDIVRGVVRSLTEYGAFIDLGGVDALLHVADISWARVGKPADVLRIGDELEVKVLKINKDTRKISVGMKQLQPDPWTVAAEKYKTGDRVRGIVARLTDFGAFVALEPGIDGLIHVSEMSWSKKVRKPSDVLQPGESVDVVVLGVNPADRRISLGLKQALGDPWELAAQKFPPGSIVEAPVINLASFGVFVDLGDGIEGMIHVGDITREKRLEHPRDVLKAGQTVRAQVLEVDQGKRRIRLGMKQLEPTSVDKYITEHQVGDTVSGRVAEVRQDRIRVELGEGVFATCVFKAEEAEQGQAAEQPQRVDIAELTARLAAKWKQGAGEGSAAASNNPGIRPGQVRSFRIAALDPGQKKIQLELAE